MALVSSSGSREAPLNSALLSCGMGFALCAYQCPSKDPLGGCWGLTDFRSTCFEGVCVFPRPERSISRTLSNLDREASLPGSPLSVKSDKTLRFPAGSPKSTVEDGLNALSPLSPLTGVVIDIAPEPLSEELEQVVELARAHLPNGELTPFQRSWCTPENVGVYLRGRKGDVHAASQIFAKAIKWRQDHYEVLSGVRQPNWQGDMRVLTRGHQGNPVVYLCFRHQPRRPVASDALDHAAAVLEAAVRSLEGDATKLDAIIDCHGFRIMSNLDPRPVIGLLEMVQQPFRERLRSVLMIDAPSAFKPVWKIISGAISEVTRKKIQFIDGEDMVSAELLPHLGYDATQVVLETMRENRSPTGPGALPLCLPSELLQGSPSHPTTPRSTYSRKLSKSSAPSLKTALASSVKAAAETVRHSGCGGSMLRSRLFGFFNRTSAAGTI